MEFKIVKGKSEFDTFYNVGQEVNIDVIEEYDFYIKPGKVSLGYRL